MRIAAVIVALVLMCASMAAAQDGGPSWTNQGAIKIATTLPDTLIFSEDGFYSGDGSITRIKQVKGVKMQARSPFRYRLHTADGIEDTAIQAVVDSNMLTGGGYAGSLPLLPCVELAWGRVDTLFITPTTSDTVYVRALY